eukprot:6205412-Pleurochrysis_carterae.AAC.1
MASTAGGGHEEAATAGVGADIDGVEAEASADAAQANAGRRDPAIEGDGVGQLPSAEGLNEVGWASCALQPSGRSDAKRLPAVARGFFRAQTISKQRDEQLVGLRGREWCGEEGNRLACTRLNREGKIEVSERLRRIARYVDVGKGDGPVTPDFARRIAFAQARGDFAPVSCREGLQLSRRRVLRRETSDHPEQRGAREPSLSLRQVSDELSFVKAADVEQAERGKEASAKKRGFG